MRPARVSRLPLIHRIARALGVALVLAFAFGLPAAVHAQGDPRIEARAHYQAGMAKFNAAQYDEAIAEFRAADQIAPAPMNDYNIALAYERKGDAVAAIKTYRGYLDRMPNAANRAEVEAAIQKLEPQAAAAEQAAEAARVAAEQAAALEAARIAAEQAATGPAGTSGDPELDRVAAINIANVRAAQPLPPPSGATAAAPPAAGNTGAPAPGGDPAKATTSRPFYKSPVFWVLAAVAVYAIIVLAEDDKPNQDQPLAGRAFLLPVGAPRSSSAPTLFRF